MAGYIRYPAPTSGTNTGDVTLAAVGSVPNANSASLSGQVLNLQPADGSNPGILTSGSQIIGGAKTFSGGLVGVTDASNATAGNIGQYISSVQSTDLAFPSTTAWGDLVSIALTAGDWDLSLNAWFERSGSTTTEVDFGISSTTGNSGTGLVLGDNSAEFEAAVTMQSFSATIANVRVSISAGATYYLKYKAVYSAGTPNARGRLSARRVR